MLNLLWVPYWVGYGGVSFRRVTLHTYALPMQEGKQASLAADFSITQFKHIGRLLMVHGRNSYKRSAALGQFVMHRGMIDHINHAGNIPEHVYVTSTEYGRTWMKCVSSLPLCRQCFPPFSTLHQSLCTRVFSWLGMWLSIFLLQLFPLVRTVCACI